MTIITLLTDFGIQDEYVGVVKGVILSINPAATLVDITHGVPAQDIAAAANTLAAAFTYFPKGSIHIVVVDPGVGSDRQIIGVRMNDHVFLAPNNGVLSMIFDQNRIDGIVNVTNEQYFHHPVSRTFHGRDIFAPVAGHLSLGVKLTALGPALSEQYIVRIDAATPKNDEKGRLEGKIIAVDRFGNLITNIQWQHMAPILSNRKPDNLVIEAGGQRIPGLVANYRQVPRGAALAIIGGRDSLEIAVREGDAAKVLKLDRNDSIWVS